MNPNRNATVMYRGTGFCRVSAQSNFRKECCAWEAPRPGGSFEISRWCQPPVVNHSDLAPAGAMETFTINTASRNRLHVAAKIQHIPPEMWMAWSCNSCTPARALVISTQLRWRTPPANFHQPSRLQKKSQHLCHKILPCNILANLFIRRGR